MPMTVYRIGLTGFIPARKAFTVKRFVLLPADLLARPGMVAVMRQFPDALACLLWLWSVADATGQVELNAESLRTGFRQATASTSNRFRHESRLLALADAGLIQVQAEEQQSGLNGFQKVSKRFLNALEQAETLAPSGPFRGE